MLSAEEISKTLRSLAAPDIAEHSQRFFQTGKGEYGEGDKFLGIRVPVLRKQVKKYKKASIVDAQFLLNSQFHEERLFALLLLVQKFSQGNEEEKENIYNLYLDNTEQINNWDLVDSSAHHIVGVYLENRDKLPLYKLAESKILWERRIAIISTFHLIKNNQFEETINISSKLIDEQSDLIHKAVGWMLREVGKRDIESERNFLKVHYKNMPRTMLRYAIERFPKQERKKYLNGLI